jgi:pimeloyl-ACP methyl ester carboxylesterase
MPQTSEFGWLDRNEYPFLSRYLTTEHGDMHYVDEGSGDILLFIHGNPTWSFMYRHLIKGLSPGYRCIALDHVGFGLSEKPHGVSYLPEFHAKNLERFIETLGLKDITLVIHDWGGPIGMAYAIRHPENIKRMIVFNTTCWSLGGVKAAERFSAFMGSPIGHFLCRHLNAFPRFMIPGLFGDRSRLTKAIHRQYIAPFSTPDSREGAWVLVKSLISQSDWMDSVWARRGVLRGRPVQILSGGKDPTFGQEKLRRWQEAFPEHRTLTYPDIGHFVAEELGSAATEPVRAFLDDTAAGLSAPRTQALGTAHDA